MIADIDGLKPSASAGLAIYGDRENGLGIVIGDGKMTVWQRASNEHKIIAQTAAPRSQSVHLRMPATGGLQFRFAVSRNGRDWTEVSNKRGNDLPP